ncbi:MAG: molybdopterin-dependent oxidoreductase, partial [Lachnospiraceae bacterium]|nr:molybdopterin-dependent oxidoreductase [Candidatus Equihabitans merdae]
MSLPDERKYAVLGTTPIRTDGYEKVTGAARYTADMSLPGMLYAAGLSAGIPNGRIISMDTEEAKKMPGVAAVVIAEDLPKMISASSHPFLANRPRCAGDLVAIVAAETKEAAEAAISHIHVEYEEYPAVMTIKEALAEGAPQVRDEYPGNVFSDTHYQIRLGNGEEAFKKCDVILEREYETQIVEHAYIEPEAVMAYTNPSDGLMTVHCPSQAPYYTRRYVAEILGIPVARVRVVQETIGGTFGGKEDGLGMMAARCAYL